MAIAGHILLCVVQAIAFVYCMCRALSLGRAYERRLEEKYPVIAAKRRTDPFHRMTFPGMGVRWRLTGEGQLDDPVLHRMRKMVYFHFAGAVLIVWLAGVIEIVVGNT
ncbi:MAG: hypothetical protein ABFE13_08165 [Phycisphaerales bacterium]